MMPLFAHGVVGRIEAGFVEHREEPAAPRVAARRAPAVRLALGRRGGEAPSDGGQAKTRLRAVGIGAADEVLLLVRHDHGPGGWPVYRARHCRDRCPHDAVAVVEAADLAVAVVEAATGITPRSEPEGRTTPMLRERPSDRRITRYGGSSCEAYSARVVLRTATHGVQAAAWTSHGPASRVTPTRAPASAVRFVAPPPAMIILPQSLEPSG